MCRLSMGEFGIPFDLNDGDGLSTRAISRGRRRHWTTTCARWMTASLSYTLWNYTPDNSNAHGDGWNGEDLSIFSRDQQRDPADIDSGGRALSAVRSSLRAGSGRPAAEHALRPVARALHLPLPPRQHDHASRPSSTCPIRNFPSGYTVEVSDGEYEILPDEQRVHLPPQRAGRAAYRFASSPSPAPPAELSPTGPVGHGRAYRAAAALFAGAWPAEEAVVGSIV